VTAAQVVLGPIADQVAGDIRARLGVRTEAVAVPRPVQAEVTPSLPLAPLLAVLGGAGNIRSVQAAPGRLLVRVDVVPDLAGSRWSEAGVRDVGCSSHGTLHLLVGEPAAATASALQTVLGQGAG
jgi:PTS system N-acetylglucosamine-specific IIC component